jgi:sulfide:quinone oxidoreductase
MSGSSNRNATRIVIVGGGVAGLEAALALRELAGERVEIKLLAPQRTFVDRPMTVLEPFGGPPAGQFAVSDILSEDVSHSLDSVTWIDRVHRQAHTRSGPPIDYDALLLCPGAAAIPAYPSAITVSGASQDATLAGMVADVDAGAVRRVAFVVPAPGCWQLPLYELALLTAARARDRSLDVSLSVFTPERVPMEGFGHSAGSSVSALLTDAGIAVVCRAVCRVPDENLLLADTADPARWPRSRPGRREQPLVFDRIVALPRLRGPRLRGVPAVNDGFIPVDVHGRILGTTAEFAAGDATNCPIKHGSVAAQQADAAAATLAGLAGASVRPAPFHPVARGVLLTGGESRRLRATIVGGHGLRSEFAGAGPADPGVSNLDARYLTPRLAQLRGGAAEKAPDHPAATPGLPTATPDHPAAANFG